MYATWRSYNVVTNLGANTQGLSFSGRDGIRWFHLTSPWPDSPKADRVEGIHGELSKDAASYDQHSARSVL